MSFITRKKNIQVGVSVTIDNRMEVVVVDTEAHKVVQYEQVEVGYNFQTKEIADYMQFASTLKNVLDEMRLNVKDIEVTITLPSIHFSTAQVQSNFDDSEIRTVLATYAQDSYLFKRHEPVIAYQTYPNGGMEEIPVVYTAIQETAVDQIKEALFSVGIDNFSINNPYGSIVNGLVYLGKLDRQINSGEIWNLVQITNNGFTLLSMIGTTIREINDMPLPLKTFSSEEIYESMALSLQNNLSIYPASSLFVISRTDLLSAQQLLQRMELRGNVDYMENNLFVTEPFIDIGEKVDSDFAKIISVECIGSTVTNQNSPLVLCYMTKKNVEDEVLGIWHVGNKDITINDANISLLMMILIGILAAFIVISISVLIFGKNYWNEEANKLQTQKSDLEKKITKAKGEISGSVETIIIDIEKNNKNSVAYFNSISKEIPSNIWLSYYYSDSNGVLSIKGDTGNVESLYDFFNGIKKSVPNSRISLSRLEYNDIDALLDPESNGNKSLKFEITSGSYVNKAKEETKEEVKGESEQENKTSNDVKNTKEQQKNKSKAKAAQKPASDSSDDTLDEDGLPEPPQFNPPAGK